MILKLLSVGLDSRRAAAALIATASLPTSLPFARSFWPAVLTTAASSLRTNAPRPRQRLQILLAVSKSFSCLFHPTRIRPAHALPPGEQAVTFSSCFCYHVCSLHCCLFHMTVAKDINSSIIGLEKLDSLMTKLVHSYTHQQRLNRGTTLIF